MNASVTKRKRSAAKVKIIKTSICYYTIGIIPPAQMTAF